jgi:hypothetical protein
MPAPAVCSSANRCESPANVFLVAQKLGGKILADNPRRWRGPDSLKASWGEIRVSEFILFAEGMRGFAEGMRGPHSNGAFAVADNYWTTRKTTE